MVSLKRNSKLELVEAKGIRNSSSSIYNPNQPDDFKISRSKFNDFLTSSKLFIFIFKSDIISRIIF